MAMKKGKGILIAAIIICMVFSGCNKEEPYYCLEYKSIDDIKELYYDNKDLFDDVVRIIGENDTLLKNGI